MILPLRFWQKFAISAFAAVSFAGTVAQGQTRIFFENFDNLVLGPNLDEGFADPTAFTHTPPPSWVVDNTELNANIPTTVDGLPNGVREWRGWSFVDPNFWVGSDNQDRDQFTRASGVIAVADPDEFDDLGDPLFSGGPFYKTILRTPSINVAGVPSNHNVYVTFDSSWLGESNDEAGENMTSIVSIGATELLRWESDPLSPNYRVGAVTGDDANPITGENYNEHVVLTIPRSQIAGSTFNVSFTMQDALNDWWWALDNIAVYTGLTPPATEVGLKIVVDRDSGTATMENNSGLAVPIRGYSIESVEGTLIESEFTPLADGPGSDWVMLNAAGSTTDLSEGKLSGTLSVANGQQIPLGDIWLQYWDELGDLSFSYLDQDGHLQNGPVEFVGNGGNPFLFGDLDFDGDVDPNDWTEFKADIPSSLAGLSKPYLYQLSDLNGDQSHSLTDIILFRQAYDAANGPGAFAALSSAVPEPATFTLLGAGVVAAMVFRGRWSSRLFILLLLAATLSAVRTASAVVLLNETFDGLAFGTTVERNPGTENAWTKTPPAGWTIDDSQMAGTYLGADDGVREFYGWNFFTADFFRAPDQNRSLFTLASGGVAAADPDEWDDAVNPDALYNSFMRTNSFALPANVGMKINFDSSWRPEGMDDLGGINNQTGTVRAIYTVGAGQQVVDLVHWNSDPDSEFYHNDREDDATLTSLDPAYRTENEHVAITTAPPGGATAVRFEWGLTQAYNDWWWAVDNIQIETFSPVILQVNKTTGELMLLGSPDQTIDRSAFAYEITSESGSLNPVGWEAGNLDAQGVGGGGSHPSDHNGDGVVNAADYTIIRDDNLGATAYNNWKASFGQSDSGGPGEGWETVISETDQLAEAFLLGETQLDETFEFSLGNGFAIGGQEDLTFEYTNPAGVRTKALVVYVTGGGSNTAVPEPSTLLLGVIGMIALGFLKRGPSRWTARSLCALGLAVLAAPSVDAAYTNDRDYRFGENDSATAGPVALNTRMANNGVGDANDSAGIPNSMGGSNQVITLVPIAGLGPTYRDTSTRPFGTAGEIGIEFIAATGADTIQAEPLGSPGESVSSSSATAAIYASGVGPFDYDGVTNRGFQMWVKPTVVNTNQVIIHDTNQHAVGISSNGSWFMQYAQAGTPTSDRTIDTSIAESAATANQWYHVMMVRPYGAFRKIEDPPNPSDPLTPPTFDADVSNGPEGGARLYINGVAVAADTGGFSTSLSYNFANARFLANSILYVGGRGTTNATGGFTGVQEPFRGIVDDLEMFVLGTSFTGTQWGNFDLATDNRFIASTLAGKGAADLNLDGFENQADVDAFVTNWMDQNLVNGLVVGDLRSRSKGDINLDGRVNLADWYQINLASPGLGASIAYSLGFGPAPVPEPSTLVLAMVSLAAGLVLQRRRRG